MSKVEIHPLLFCMMVRLGEIVYVSFMDPEPSLSADGHDRHGRLLEVKGTEGLLNVRHQFQDRKNCLIFLCKYMAGLGISTDIFSNALR